MNKTKIEWASMSWSPVTGCLEGCSYCYARGIATRFGSKKSESMQILYAMNGGVRPDMFKGNYPYGFLPTYHPYRFYEPERTKTPQNIFVCSMADLFGDWVQREWIEDVFDACDRAPWHNYIFLTKNPSRYEEFLDRFTKNMWIGATITNNYDMNTRAYDLARAAFHTGTENYFLSIEPLMDRIHKENLKLFNWVIIGVETGNRKNRVKPKRDWIESIVEEYKRVNIPIFMKESLEGLWPEELIQELPEGLKRGVEE